MVFSSNPLALSVPDTAFESWLRDKGYLEILDQHASDLHRISTSAATSSSSSSSTTATGGSNSPIIPTIRYGLFISLFSYVKILVSIFTLNPFSKLSTDDFSGDTPSWTEAFIGSLNSYSLPSSTAQARLRAHENVKRFARNYAFLFILFFACSLYQMPLALVGLLLSLALWDVFKYYGDQWGLEQYPILRQALVRIAQCVCHWFLHSMGQDILLSDTIICFLISIVDNNCSINGILMPLLNVNASTEFSATAVILFFSNVQVAIFCAVSVSYAVMILHASLRKLTSPKQCAQSDRNRRNH